MDLRTVKGSSMYFDDFDWPTVSAGYDFFSSTRRSSEGVFLDEPPTIPKVYLIEGVKILSK